MTVPSEMKRKGSRCEEQKKWSERRTEEMPAGCASAWPRAATWRGTCHAHASEVTCSAQAHACRIPVPTGFGAVSVVRAALLPSCLTLKIWRMDGPDLPISQNVLPHKGKKIRKKTCLPGRLLTAGCAGLGPASLPAPPLKDSLRLNVTDTHIRPHPPPSVERG